MAKIRNHQIFNGNGQAPVVQAALNDILSQRINSEIGLAVRQITREISARLEDIDAERKRIIELHAKKDENGKPVETTDEDGNTVYEFEDVTALNEDYLELLNGEFEVQGIPASKLRGVTLNGATWFSPIIEE